MNAKLSVRVLAATLLLLICVSNIDAQVPTLSLAAGKVGITSNAAGTASNYKFYMEASGSPRAVTAGETIFMMGSWPNGKNPTMSDDQSNAWAAVPSCTDGTNTNHGIFYAINAAANTSVITETHSSNTVNTVFDWAHFYNMGTTSGAIVDGSSCKTGVTPSNNTAPNINGTAYTTATGGDLILVCAYVEQSPFGDPNAISSLTWPSGFTGLSEDVSYGHACAYGIQSAAGSFTPTFTFAQNAHNSFTIMSAAFKAGNGGTAPGTGASILLSEMNYSGSAGQTVTVYLPCPSNTTAVVVMDDAGSVSNVSDSSSSTWSHASIPQNFWGPIYWTNNPTFSTNTYKVSMTFGNNAGNEELPGLFCLGGTAGIDTGATAQSGSTQDGSGAAYNSQNVSGSTITNIPSISTSLAGDLIMDVGAIGVGPAESCITGHCVFDYVGSTTWSNGDQESYANGDIMAHQYMAAVGTAQFEFNVVNTGSSASTLAVAFKAASGAPPPPPVAPSSVSATPH